MNIFERIEQDHDKQRKLMAAIKETSGDSPERRKLFDEFSTELRAHAAAEEHAFYAELMKEEDTTDQSRHSVAEHHEELEILDELDKMDMSSSGWLQRFGTLAHDNEHHMEEEEKEVFPAAKKALSDERLGEMLSIFNERKDSELPA